jgi:soluble lytic murein transglycosylase
VQLNVADLRQRGTNTYVGQLTPNTLLAASSKISLMTFKHLFTFLATLAAAMVGANTHANDAAVKDAAEGFRLGEMSRIGAALPQVRGHVLEGYVEYWALRLAIDGTRGDDVERFLEKHKGSAIAERMRVDWLKQLGKTERWDEFSRIGTSFETDDSEVTCYRATFAARAMPAGVSNGSEINVPNGVWAERLTEACAQAFAALAEKNRVTTDDAIWRLRTSAEGSTLLAASRVAAALPDSARPSEEQLRRAHSNPDIVLKQGNAPFTRAQREAGLYALTRYARTDAARAATAWQAAKQKFSEEDQRYAAATLAYFHARKLESDEAMNWFKRAGSEQNLTRIADWKAAWIARAAMREGQWGELLRVINAMSVAANGGQMDPTWRYWKARSLAALGDANGANALYTELAKEFHYHGLLAAEEINAPLPAPELLKAGALKATDDELRRFDQSAAAKRVLKLSELGLRAEAAREWYSVVRDFGDADSLLAAEWMRRKGIWDRSINTAERTKTQHDFALRFQTPYANEIRKAALAVNVDPSLTFGLIRQESRFWAEAVSSAGALGLMQVMPSTGKWIAQQLNIRDYRPSQLTDINVSTGFGAFYLKNALNNQGGSEVLAAAAYNAGAGRARAWRDERRALEGAIYTESILFNETRDYVKKVLANAVWYAHLGMGGETSLKKRLGVIQPKG